MVLVSPVHLVGNAILWLLLVAWIGFVVIAGEPCWQRRNAAAAGNLTRTVERHVAQVLNFSGGLRPHFRVLLDLVGHIGLIAWHYVDDLINYPACPNEQVAITVEWHNYYPDNGES